MMTNNVIHRVFFIKGDDQYGTAFSIDVDGRQYLVTAKHLFKNSKNTSSLKFMHNNQWLDLKVAHVGSSPGEIDIAVYSPSILLSENWKLEPSIDGIIIGQDVYFVGYPYKMWTDAGKALSGKPCPFIKKGIISSSFDPSGVHILYIDAINNEGFSGGPIIFKKPGCEDFQIGGVVSKFRTEIEDILNKDGEPSGMTYHYNTGLLIGYSIEYAKKLIRVNPIGYQLA